MVELHFYYVMPLVTIPFPIDAHWERDVCKSVNAFCFKLTSQNKDLKSLEVTRSSTNNFPHRVLRLKIRCKHTINTVYPIFSTK